MSEPQERSVTRGKHLARLLIQSLAPADVEQVQAVVNNLRHQTFNDWHLVEQGPADLALTGHGTAAAERSPFGEAKVTLQLFEPVTHRPSRYGVLVSPLRFAALSTALTDVDRRLAARRANAPDGRDAITLSAVMLPPLRRRGDMGLRAVMKGQARVRLRRRPPADIAAGHQDDAALVRLLMSGHLTIDELVNASQQSLAACCALLRDLAAAALLDVQMTLPSAAPSSVGGGSAPSQRPTTKPASDIATHAATHATDHPIQAATADDERSDLAQMLWRELGFLRSC